MRRKGYKLVLMALAILLVATAFIACGGGGGSDGQSRVQDLIDADKQDIKDVVTSFLPELSKLNYDGMKEYATDNMKHTIELYESALLQGEEEGLEIISIRISNIRLQDEDITLDTADRYPPEDELEASEWKGLIEWATASPIYDIEITAEYEGEKQSKKDAVPDTFRLRRSDNNWLIDEWSGVEFE